MVKVHVHYMWKSASVRTQYNWTLRVNFWCKPIIKEYFFPLTKTDLRRYWTHIKTIVEWSCIKKSIYTYMYNTIVFINISWLWKNMYSFYIFWWFFWFKIMLKKNFFLFLEHTVVYKRVMKIVIVYKIASLFEAKLMW